LIRGGHSRAVSASRHLCSSMSWKKASSALIPGVDEHFRQRPARLRLGHQHAGFFATADLHGDPAMWVPQALSGPGSRRQATGLAALGLPERLARASGTRNRQQTGAGKGVCAGISQPYRPELSYQTLGMRQVIYCCVELALDGTAETTGWPGIRCSSCETGAENLAGEQGFGPTLRRAGLARQFSPSILWSQRWLAVTERLDRPQGSLLLLTWMRGRQSRLTLKRQTTDRKKTRRSGVFQLR